MNLIAGCLLRRVNLYETICVHEKHWSDYAQWLDKVDRKDPNICYECLDKVKEEV